jgi:hypothetical protein
MIHKDTVKTRNSRGFESCANHAGSRAVRCEPVLLPATCKQGITGRGSPAWEQTGTTMLWQSG